MATIAAPPWEDTKFNVKKPPPKVPKPSSLPKRVVPASSASPSGDASQQKSCPQHRWGQLGSAAEVAAASDDASQVPTSSIPIKTEMFSNPAGLMSTVLDADSLSEDPSNANRGITPSAPSTPQSSYQSQWKQLNTMPNFEEKLQRLRRPNVEKAPEATNPSREALAFFEELIAGPCHSSDTFLREKLQTGCKDEEPVTLSAHLNEASKRLKAQAEEARKRRESAQAQAEEAQKRKEKEEKPSRPQSSAAAMYKKFIDQPKADKSSSRDLPKATTENTEETKREHQEKLAAMERELEEERRRFAEEMERNRLEEEKRAKQQEEWRNKLMAETEERKKQVRQDMAAKQAEKEEAERRWKQDWWAHWKKSEERAKQKGEDHAKWSQEWWANFKPTEEEKADFERWAKDQEDKDAQEEDFWAGFEKRWQERTRNSTSYKRHSASGFGHGQRGEQSLMPGKKPEGHEEGAVWDKVRQSMSLSQDERKRVWKELCLQWHPDKCAESGDQVRAKEVFQYLQGLKDWLLPEKS